MKDGPAKFGYSGILIEVLLKFNYSRGQINEEIIKIKIESHEIYIIIYFAFKKLQVFLDT
jgi:hypothetical protein